MDQEVIPIVIKFLKEEFKDDTTGHDWFHIKRVYENACFIQTKEGGNKTVIELAALLHDISDHKFNGGKLNIGGQIGYELLRKKGCSKEIASQVKEIIDVVSFKGALVKDTPKTLEAKIVQDADRLDAMGAIGIARAFAFGGNKNRPIYDPNTPPILHDNFEAYSKSKSHTVNHFYEKLLLLKDRLHTSTAKNIGQLRHDYMLNFLEQFKNEWSILKK